MKQTVLVLTALALAMVHSDRAEAQIGSATSTVACCQLTTSLGNDQIRGRDVLGDERFFMADSTPPNIHFQIDTSVAMLELPQIQNSDQVTFFNSEPVDPNWTGCTNSYLVAEETARNWNPTNSYPPVDTGVIPNDAGFPTLFVEKDASDGLPRFYSYMSWTDPRLQNAPTPIQDRQKKDISSSAGVCATLHNPTTEPGAYQLCQKCLDQRGFYKKPGVTLPAAGDPAKYPNFVFSGKFLNFNPPKYVALRWVLKTVVRDMRRVRSGYSYLVDDPKIGTVPTLGRKQNPPCNQLAGTSSFDSNRGSYISDINGIPFGASKAYTARHLYNVGQYLSSSDNIYTNVFKFDPVWLVPSLRNTLSDPPSDSRSWCWGCQKSSVIIISGSVPKDDNLLPRTLLEKWNGGTVQCLDNTCATVEAAKKDDLLDDVAKFLHTQDLHQDPVPSPLDFSGRQSLDIYGVTFNADSNLLRSATEQWGGGLYFTAQNATTLKDAITEAIANIEARATSFASGSVGTLQINRSGGSVLPRLVPAKSGVNRPWQGLLYRFNLDSEARLGCVAAKAATLLTGGLGDSKDLNRDGDCKDSFLLDKAGDPIVEDEQGKFVKLANPSLPAVPFWEAGSVMKCSTSSNCEPVPNPTLTQKWKTRKIWTIIDNGGPSGQADGRIDRYDTPIEFNESNAALLRDYLGLGSNPAGCNSIQTQLGLASLSTDECAAVVIRWYRGADALNADPAKRDSDRTFLLQDIFHSAPIIVEPLSDKVLCGFGSQCLDTLFYMKELLSPDGSDGRPDAYLTAYQQARDRDRIILVGSNGGVLHAFLGGRKTGVDPVDGTNLYDEGTGEELWAFIPPDLLPKLKPNVGKHAYFVDGTPMVRDVWIDANGDHLKQAEEFRTVAVVGEGSGGVHRFALDLTRLIGQSATRSHQVPNQRGDFLWIWPQPCDAEALLVGESSGDFVPKPPPIGPVAIKRTDGPYRIATDDGTVRADERWIVFVNAGYDPYMVRGRGLAMIDIATGKSLWTFRYKDGSPNATEARYPFSAPVSLLDVGNSSGSNRNQDRLFDTATVGDMGGSVWTVRFWVPGEVDPSTNKVTNWFAARSFQAPGSSALSIRPPITSMTSNAVQPDTGYLRTFVGTGDCYNLLDSPGNICRLSNPRACALQGCAARSQITVTRGGVETNYAKVQFSNQSYETDTYRAATGGSACLGSKISVWWDLDTGGQCVTTSVAPGTLEYTCDGSATTWSCRTTLDNWVVTADTQSTPLPPTGPHRFYGFHSYGVTKSFGTGRGGVAGDRASALAFDQARLTEAQLVDVTDATVDASGRVSVYASAQGDGWYIRYLPLDERTATTATVLDGCVLWNSFQPTTASSLCSTAGTNLARLYQAGFVDGAPNCAAAFYLSGTWVRHLDRSVTASPAAPTPQRSVYRGSGNSGIASPEAGGVSSTAVTENRELVQSVYHLLVDRKTHDCRHENVECE